MPEDFIPAPEAWSPPAKLKGLHRAAGTQIPVGHRSVKMLRPTCAECAPNTSVAPAQWWLQCPHQPYVGEKGEVVVEQTYEDDPDGGRVIASTQSKTVLRPWPNFVGIPLVQRISSGRGPEYKAVLNGFILPEDLRCDAYPNGIAPMCEFRECYWQEDLKDYSTGRFCQEAEAVVVYEDSKGIAAEVYNTEIRSDQFEGSKAKVGAGS